MRIDRRTAATLGTLAGVVVLALLSWVLSSGDDPASPQARASSTSSASSGTGTDPDGSLPRISPEDLPSQAQDLLRLIDDGGPFPSGDRDGVEFRNDEGSLPRHGAGYYREYTARTPGEGDRGARRIIAGSAGELYWTADHYESFARIVRP